MVNRSLKSWALYETPGSDVSVSETESNTLG